jgi:hypothetical protein
VSAETLHAVEDAVAAHIADANGGAYLTGYVLVATGVSPEDEIGVRYSIAEPVSQPPHVTLGLIEYVRMLSREMGAGEQT